MRATLTETPLPDAVRPNVLPIEPRSTGVPAKFASYADDLGVMLDGTAQNKIFTLDGGGGTSNFAQGKPYFWGTRAITPNDPSVESGLSAGFSPFCKGGVIRARNSAILVW